MKYKFLSIYLITILFVVLGMIFTSKMFAASPSSILIDIIPSNPAPYESVGITLNSYANNLDTVLITWSLDGKNVSSGIGKKSFSLTAPAAGSESIVTVIISLPEGSVEKKMTIRPNSMVLLWQANDSYVPPFYKGKAMPTPDSEIKIVAMPEIKTSAGLVSPKNMTYSWKMDYTNDQENSGYGKNSFLFTSDYLENSSSISVVASTLDQKYSSEASISVETTEPKILFYKNDGSIGTIWEKALADQHKIEDAEVVEAAPYFISPEKIQNPRLIWNWFINDNAIDVPVYRKNFVPLKAEAGVHGVSKLRLEIENMDKIFQTAGKEISIEF